MSQDLFAAFGSEEKAPPAKTPQSLSGPARHNPRGPPKPLDFESILNAKPYDEFATDPVSIDDDDDDFGDFEDASPMNADTKASILKARMGSPLPNADMPFFDAPWAKPLTPGGRAPSKSISHLPFKPNLTGSAATASSSGRSHSATKSVSHLPFKPRPAGPSNVSASSRPTSKPIPSLPFKPKPAQSNPKAENIGAHPFAGRMDMLFDGDDDDYDAGADDLNVDLANDPEAAMAYSKRLIAEGMANQKPQAPAPKTAPRSHIRFQEDKPAPNKLKKKSQYAPAKNPNVLFDVDNVSEEEKEDEDDWGTFETSRPRPSKLAPTAPRHNKSKSASAALGFDLLSLDHTPTQWASQDLQLKQTSSNQEHKIQDDEGWDDFDDISPSPAKVSTSFPTLPKSTINMAAPANPAYAPELPPTNIPPPAVLLSIFPSVIASAQPALFDPLAKLPHNQKHELLSQQETQQFLRGYIALATVLAHIIAGRKQRWKRDQFLAQGMRIGPAAAGGRGGMKLANVDRAEVAKEEREVLEAVRQWRSIVGKLRSAVVSANSKTSTKLPPVPEISELVPLKILVPIEGGITAPHACALCGLKREERVPKLDDAADDTFGEWWVEGMNMHLLCKNFWDGHEDFMRSR